MYQKYLPGVPHLAEDRHGSGSISSSGRMSPSTLSGPDRFHAIRAGLGNDHDDPRNRLCASRCAPRDEGRRYLNWRINRQVNKEDTALISRVQAGMSSSSYDVGPLGTSEVCPQAICAQVCVRSRRGTKPAAAAARLEPQLRILNQGARVARDGDGR